MGESAAAMPTDENESSSGTVVQIDLAKYRTADLADELTELISVPEAFRKILKATLFVVALAIIACCLIYLYSPMSLIPLLAICVYCLLAAVLFGFALGVLRVITSALQNVESILQIVLETTGKVASDYEQLHSGNTQMPSGGVLVAQVYDGVVLPVLERAVARAFGLLGRPLLWAYRRTIGSAVRYLIKRVDRIELPMPSGDDGGIVENTRAGLAAIAKYSETIEAYTTSAAGVVVNIGRRIRFCAMLPMYIVFFVCLMLAAVPVLLVQYFFASG